MRPITRSLIGPTRATRLYRSYAGYLDADVQAYLATIAAKKGVPLSELANDLLKREIGIIEAVK